MTEGVHIAVVGHTNTGKTSLLRTLTRNASFGEVSDRPSTTQHVEAANILLHGRVVMTLYDTPGLESPVDLLDEMEKEATAGLRPDGSERLAHFLTSTAAQSRFEQEAKVLRCLQQCQVGLYVIDVRDPVLAKYRDELLILSYCAVPVVPVLNFTGSQTSNEQKWREVLARSGLHAVVRFDTVAPEQDGEKILYETLSAVLTSCRDIFRSVLDFCEQQKKQRHDAALYAIAELLVDVAACRVIIEQGTKNQAEVSDTEKHVVWLEQLHDKVRRREQQCVSRLLQIYQFTEHDIHDARLPLLNGRWETDLFHPEVLQDLGMSVGTGAAAGAAAGLGVDMMLGGVSLGAAAAIGALSGGGLQAIRHFGGYLWSKVTGRVRLTVDDAIIRLLALRQLYLQHALEGRGHAAVTPVPKFTVKADVWRTGRLPEVLIRARAHPEWCSFIGREERMVFAGEKEAVETSERTDSIVQLKNKLVTDMNRLF